MLDAVAAQVQPRRKLGVLRLEAMLTILKPGGYDIIDTIHFVLGTQDPSLHQTPLN